MRPGRSLFIAALAACFTGAASYFLPDFFKVWQYIVFILLPFIIADGIILFFFTDRLKVERKIASSLAIGHRTIIELSIMRQGKGINAGNICLFDLYDDLFECNAFPLNVKLPANSEKLTIPYEAIPFERGNWIFPACDLLLSSPLHFWRLKVRAETVSRGRIYPDFSILASSSDLRAVIELAGQKSVRKRGAGIEFDHLRDWQSGDSVRAVDWRATSRRGKVIIREYIEEQDQQILFILDSGYRLHRQEEAAKGGRAPPPDKSARTGEGVNVELLARRGAKKGAVTEIFSAPAPNTICAVSPRITTQFDSALNAALLLSWVALKHGDAVAGAVFGNMERWIPPRRGMNALPFLMNGLYDVKSASCPSSIFSALETALGRLKRRAFIMLVSNFREEDEEQLSWILPRIGKRHLLLLANIREPQAEALARRWEQGGAHGDEILTAASAYSYIAARKKLMTRWENQGLLTLESTAAALSSELINSYLSIKRSGAL